nr:hypothetical protein [Catenulispora acidiphila]
MDEVLSGGITNAGAVIRRGEIVDRPAQAHAAAIIAFWRRCRSTASLALPGRSA